MQIIYFFLLLLAVSLELGESATLTYYSDAQCKTKGGGPPYLVSNPITLELGKCTKLVSYPGFNVYMKDTGCETGGKATAQVYNNPPNSNCSGKNTTKTPDEGKCESEEDFGQTFHFIVTCGAPGANSKESAGSTGAVVGGVIGGLVVIGCIAYYYFFYVYKPQQVAEEAGKTEPSSNPVHA